MFQNVLHVIKACFLLDCYRIGFDMLFNLNHRHVGIERLITATAKLLQVNTKHNNVCDAMLCNLYSESV